MTNLDARFAAIEEAKRIRRWQKEAMATAEAACANFDLFRLAKKITITFNKCRFYAFLQTWLVSKRF